MGEWNHGDYSGETEAGDAKERGFYTSGWVHLDLTGVEIL